MNECLDTCHDGHDPQALGIRHGQVSPRSNRFLPPPEGRLPRLRQPWSPREVFAEGQWQSIRAGLERQGWSASQIEMVHDQLRQGWPLAVAKQNVAAITRQCPVRSRSLEA